MITAHQGHQFIFVEEFELQFSMVAWACHTEIDLVLAQHVEDALVLHHGSPHLDPYLTTPPSQSESSCPTLLVASPTSSGGL